MTGLKDLNPFYEKQDKSIRYWSSNSPTEAIEEADRLFEQRKFLDAYELLNRPKFNNSPEVQWRIGRVLYKLSTAEEITKKVKWGMIEEAIFVLNGSMKTGGNFKHSFNIFIAYIPVDPTNPNIHKWIAIVNHAKAGMTGTAARIQSYEFVIYHLKQAVELNPNDAVSLYMLGKLYYELASLTIFQRFIVRILYHSSPECNFNDALEYFLKAEDAKPRFYLPNLYMLGITCLKMNQMFRAR